MRSSKWKLEGYTRNAISLDFDKLKIMTKYKTSWSRARIFRAFHAELHLQANKSRSPLR